MICKTAKHLPDVPDADFKCPKCGATVGDFYTDEAHAENECEKLAAGDMLICAKCGHGENAGTFVRRWAKAKRMIICPTCKGTGVTLAASPEPAPPEVKP